MHPEGKGSGPLLPAPPDPRLNLASWCQRQGGGYRRRAPLDQGSRWSPRPHPRPCASCRPAALTLEA